MKVEMARQELHFKMRVLDLLEAFLEKENESIFIPVFCSSDASFAKLLQG